MQNISLEMYNMGLRYTYGSELIHIQQNTFRTYIGIMYRQNTFQSSKYD